MIYEYEFLFSLLLTIIVETLVLFFVVKYFFKLKRISNSLLIFLGIFCSFATLPYLWFIFPLFLETRNIFILFGEFLVVLIESIIYYFVLKVGWKKAVVLSLVCNLASFLVGLFI